MVFASMLLVLSLLVALTIAARHRQGLLSALTSFRATEQKDTKEAQQEQALLQRADLLRQLGVICSARSRAIKLSPEAIGSLRGTMPAVKPIELPETHHKVRFSECGQLRVMLTARRTPVHWIVERRATAFKLIGDKKRERIAEKDLGNLLVPIAQELNLDHIMTMALDQLNGAAPAQPAEKRSNVVDFGAVREERPRKRAMSKMPTRATPPRSPYTIGERVQGKVQFAGESDDRPGFCVVLDTPTGLRKFYGTDLMEAHEEGQIVVGEPVAITFQGKVEGLPIRGETVTRNKFSVEPVNDTKRRA